MLSYGYLWKLVNFLEKWIAVHRTTSRDRTKKGLPPLPIEG